MTHSDGLKSVVSKSGIYKETIGHKCWRCGEYVQYPQGSNIICKTCGSIKIQEFKKETAIPPTTKVVGILAEQL